MTKLVRPLGRSLPRLLGLLALCATPAAAQTFDLDPDSIDFGQVAVGETVTRSLRLTNTGNQQFQVQSVTPGGSGAFAFQQPGSFPIGPGLTWTLQVRFRPPTAGTFNGSIRIQIAGAPLATVPLTGVGVENQPRLRITPMRLDFGAVELGEQATRSVGISNEGNEVLRISSLRSSPADFELETPGGFDMLPGEEREVRVTFRPTRVGGFDGALTVESDDPDQPSRTVRLLGIGQPPPIDFAASIEPMRLRLTPGGSIPVSIRLRNLGTTPLEVRTIGTHVELPDGSIFALGGPETGSVIVPGNGTVQLPGLAFLPEASYDASPAGSNEVRFVQTFSGSAQGSTIEREAEAILIPVGALGSEFTVHTVSIDFPFQSTSVAAGTVLRARAQVFGRGIGSASGRWLVDGIPFESLAVDLDGRSGITETLGELPTAFLGRHSVSLEILEPVSIRTPPVYYTVTPQDTEGMRWVVLPGEGTYLRSGRLPDLAWTPRAGATYYLELGTEHAARRRTTSWRPDAAAWAALASGTHTLAVRAIIGDPDRPLFEERLEREITLLETPLELESGCDGDGCFWTPAPGGSLYAVEWRSSGGSVVYRRITAQTRLSGPAVSALLSPSEGLTWSVSARNDHGETVGESEAMAWPEGWR